METRRLATVLIFGLHKVIVRYTGMYGIFLFLETCGIGEVGKDSSAQRFSTQHNPPNALR